jgi:hypothetical protein
MNEGNKSFLSTNTWKRERRTRFRYSSRKSLKRSQETRRIEGLKDLISKPLQKRYHIKVRNQVLQLDHHPLHQLTNLKERKLSWVTAMLSLTKNIPIRLATSSYFVCALVFGLATRVTSFSLIHHGMYIFMWFGSLWIDMDAYRPKSNNVDNKFHSVWVILSLMIS